MVRLNHTSSCHSHPLVSVVVGRDERVAASLPFQYLASHVPAVHVMRYALMISQVGLVGPEKPSHTTAVAIDGANYYIRLS